MPRLKSYPIETVEGVERVHAERLIGEGVRTTGQLLKRGAHPQGRALLAARTGIAEDEILRWIHRADLMRIPGVGKQFSELLEAAGIADLRDLGTREPRSLAALLDRVNGENHLAGRTPTTSMVELWVDEACELPGVVQS